ncbi:MAG: HAD family phosphatase [Lachnospiraceae bacterium]|nr:HAD family phosphatase [Lachnospiraceae bacterium]
MNNSDMKLLFFDIDGTLITDDSRKYYPDSTKEAIRKAREKGHKCFINTGRVYATVDDYIRQPGFDGFVCGCGTNIYADGQEVLYVPYSREKSVKVAELCRKYDYKGIFEHKNHIAFDGTISGGEHRVILDYFINMGVKIIDDIHSEEFVFDKLAVWHGAGNPNLEEFKNQIREDFQCIIRSDSFVELIPHGYSKATGIKFLMDYYNVPIENVFVFGDSNNDLEMLKYVPNSIAMGVCSKEVARVASYRTDTVENDGIYKAMKHFGVI